MTAMIKPASPANEFTETFTTRRCVSSAGFFFLRFWRLFAAIPLFRPMNDTARKPAWLRAKLPSGPGYNAVRKLVDDHKLHTVCQSAQCPNLGECWSRGTATVMILGNICTRSCNFCAIQTGRPTEYDLGEPARVAEAVAVMNLKHCVITSVNRDELKDGGSKIWAETITRVRAASPLQGATRLDAGNAG